MKFNLSHTVILLLSFLVSACTEIPENERSVLVEKYSLEDIAELGRAVLLEDYTGIYCSNCPRATVTANEIKQVLGEALVIVSIHTGVFSNGSPFNTAVGDAYKNKFYPKDEGYPAGMISRTKFNGLLGNTNDATWKTDILTKLFSDIPKIKLSLSNNYNEADSSFTVTSNITASETWANNLKLQLWLTENGIQHFQVNGIPSAAEYIHNHVLRDAINGTWGEDVTVKVNEATTYTANYTLAGKTWTPANSGKPENMHIVGFIYDSKTMEVIDVKEISLKTVF